MYTITMYSQTGERIENNKTNMRGQNGYKKAKSIARKMLGTKTINYDSFENVYFNKNTTNFCRIYEW